jgi:ATP-dependent exoDNAse (exonuclease V) alpha subunit
MVKAIRFAGKVYQSALRANLDALGYETCNKVNDKGQVEGFEIDGISDELCEKYSQRRSEIEEAIDAFTVKYGRPPTAAETHVIAKETRTSKLTNITTAQVRTRQRNRASPAELGQIEHVRAQALGASAAHTARGQRNLNALAAAELVAFVREHLAERHATFGEHDLIAEALNKGMGKVSLARLREAIRHDPEIVRLDSVQNAMSVLTNRTNLIQEKESVAFVNAGVDSRAPINACLVPFADLIEQAGKWIKIDPATGAAHDYTDQRRAVTDMLQSTDQVFALRGVAGTGKTTALKEFHAGVLAAGRRHILLAPTRKAVEALAREIPDATVDTIEAFLLRFGTPERKAELGCAVITVDEWGLLSNRAGHALLRIAQEAGADVRFVGDTRQHVAVEAGDFARTLEAHSKLRSTTLSTISRQRDPDYRAAVTDLAAGRIKDGLAKLDEKGWIHEGKSGYLIEAAARYLGLSEFGSKILDNNGSPHVLAVGPTHAEIRAFTAQVREQMREHGALRGPVIKRAAFIAHDFTRAARRSWKTYAIGAAVTLVPEKTKVRGLVASEVYIVAGMPKKDFVTLADRASRTVTINVRSNGHKLELGALGEIELQAGDRLWFRANAKGVTNGTLGTLAGTDSDGRLVTTDGFVVPDDYLKVAHGYAATSHSSQGLTSNYAVVFGAVFDAKSVYVSHSRARAQVDTYVPSKEAFLSRAERAQGDRLGVLEAIEKAQGIGLIDLITRQQAGVSSSSESNQIKISGPPSAELTPEKNFVDTGHTFSSTVLARLVGWQRGEEQVSDQQVADAATSQNASGPEQRSGQAEGGVPSEVPSEVLIEKGRAPYRFETGNEQSPFLRTVDQVGKERIYWGADLPRAAAGVEIGDIITAARVDSKPVSVTHQESQADGSEKEVETRGKRNTWEVTKHGHNKYAVVAAYNARVDGPEARAKLEKFNPALVKARDQIVSEQKKEKLAREQASRAASQAKGVQR